MTAQGAIYRRLSRLGHALWRPWLKRRLECTRLETLDGVHLVVLPEVFHPLVFRSGTLLARTLDALPTVHTGTRMLDMGTGTGIGAVFGARRGYRVVAVDINPEAVRCARINALLSGVEQRVEVREGDLFAPVAGERFELVTFNPPYFRGPPRSDLDAAWRGDDVLERFADGLPAVLAPEGRALLVLSSDGACDLLLERLESRGLVLSRGTETRYGTETLTAWWTRSA